MSAIDDRIAEIEARPDAEEALRERVAGELWHEDGGDVRWVALARDSWSRRRYLRLADAAIAVMTTPVGATS